MYLEAKCICEGCGRPAERGMCINQCQSANLKVCFTNAIFFIEDGMSYAKLFINNELVENLYEFKQQEMPKLFLYVKQNGAFYPLKYDNIGDFRKWKALSKLFKKEFKMKEFLLYASPFAKVLNVYYIYSSKTHMHIFLTILMCQLIQKYFQMGILINIKQHIQVYIYIYIYNLIFRYHKYDILYMLKRNSSKSAKST